ncbi:MAG: hypothetical protein LBU88_02165 [Treponema sp.]|jgi:hypothetical protein|nr:hypothetical protein [Treponema sp.]
MKKFCVFTAIFIFLAVGVWGQTTYSWNIAGGDWHTPGNWTPNGTPGPADSVIINNAAAWGMTLSGNVTVQSFTVAPGVLGNLNLGGYTLEVVDLTYNNGAGNQFRLDNGTVNVTGTTTLNGVLESNAHVDVFINHLIVDGAGTVGFNLAPGTITMNGANLIMLAHTDPNQLTIQGVPNPPVNLNAGHRHVTIDLLFQTDVVLGGATTAGSITIINGSVKDSGTLNSGSGSISIESPPYTGPGPVIIVDGDPVVVSSGTYIWTGAAGAWNVPGNWEVGGVTASDYPGQSGAGNEVIINTGGNVVLNVNITNTLDSLVNAGELTLGANNLSTVDLANTGTLSLIGNAGQISGGTHTTMGGTVVFTGAGTTFAGISDFSNLTILGGARNVSSTAVTVGGNLNIIGGSLTANSLAVTGTSAISGGITTTGSQTYGSAVAFNTGTYTLSAVGYTITLPNTVTVNGAATLTANNISLAGTVSGTGSLTFNNTTVTGSNTFTDNVTLICTGTVQFAAGSIQNFTGFAVLNATGAVALQGASLPGQWFIVGLSALNFTASPTTTIKDLNFHTPLNWTAGVDAADGGNNTNVFSAGSVTYTWTGATNSIWATDTNWQGGVSPLAGNNTAIIIITNAGYSPQLTANLACDTLTINPGAEINLVNFNLTAATTITNNGTIQLHGVNNQVTVGGTAPAGIAGTISYYGTVAGGNYWIFGDTYTNLTVESTAAMRVIPSLFVTGTSAIKANITTDSGGQTYNGPVILGNNVNFTGDPGTSIQFVSTVSGDGTDRSLTVTDARVQFDGAVGGNISSVNITFGDTYINADITTVSGQTYAGQVTLGGGVSGTLRTLTAGGTVQFDSIVNGERVLSITGSNVIFNERVGNMGVTGLTSLTVIGPAVINSASIRTTGGQTYGGAVTLGNNVQFISNASTAVRFGSTVSGAGGVNRSLSVTGANAQFNGTVSGNIGDIEIDGTADINANITTGGYQTYSEDVTLSGGSSGDTRFLAGGGTIWFLGTVNGDRALSVTSPDIYFDKTAGNTGLPGLYASGTSTINANITTTGNQTYNGPVILRENIDFTGNTGALIHFANTVSSLNAAARTLRIINADAQFDGAVGGNSLLPINGVSVAGASRINADITTTGNQTYNGAVTLGTDVSFIGGASTVVRFGSTVSGDGTDRSLAVTNANAQFDGVVGTNIGNISIDGTTVINAINATITTTGNQTYSGPVILGTDVIFRGNTGALVHFEDIVRSDNAVARILVILDAGAQFDGIVGGDPSFPIANVTVNGVSTINANITTTGIQTYIGAVTLGANVDFTGGVGDTVRFANTVSSTSATARTLRIINADAQFEGAIGGNPAFPINGVSVGGASRISANITTTGGQTYTGAVTLAANVTFVGGVDTTVRFANTVRGEGAPRSLTVNATTTRFDGIVGGSASINNVTISGFSSINATIFTTNAQTYNGMITLPGTEIAEYPYLQAGGNVYINGVDSASRRLKIISIFGTVTLAGNIRVVHNGFCSIVGGGEAAIHVDANVLNITGSVTLQGNQNNGGAFCAFVNSYTLTGSISGGRRIHFHAKDAHIVYRDGADPGSLLGADPYLYIQADDYDVYSLPEIIEARPGFNIYIMDVNDTPAFPLLPKNPNFTVSGTGFIEFRDTYISGGTLTLNPNGTGGIQLNNAEIHLTDSQFVINGTNKNIHIIATANKITAVGITLEGNITTTGNGANSLELISGIGSTGIFGNIGTAANRLSDVSINGNSINFPSTTNIYTNNAPIDLTGSVNITGNVEFNSAGTGDITFNSAINGAGNLTLLADAGGIFIISPVGPGTSLGNFSVTSGNVNVGANISAGNISFTPQVTLANNVIFTVPSAGGTVILTGGTTGAFNLTLRGGSEANPLQISQSTGTIGNIIIPTGSYAAVNTGFNIRQANAGTLTLQAGAVLDTSSGSWHIGSGGSLTNDFDGINGSLVLNAGSRLITNNLNLNSASFTVNNTGTAYITVKGNAAIGVGADINFSGDSGNLVFEMTGGTQNLTANQPFYRLHIKTGSTTNLQSNLHIYGEVVIEYPGFLNAGSNNITVYAGLTGAKTGVPSARIGRWEIIGAPENITNNASSIPMVAFTQNSGGFVEFKKHPSETGDVFFEIIGNTVWQEFKCEVPGAVVQFSVNPDHHVFLEKFTVKGSSSNNVTVTRLHTTFRFTASGGTRPPGSNFSSGSIDNSLPTVPASGDLKSASNAEKDKFWNFNLIGTGAGAIGIQYVTLFFSHAWYQRIPVADEWILEAIPYYQNSDNLGYFNYDWIRIRQIIYSFIEDSSGNGKADRIRVQASVSLNGDFSDFAVAVEGYEVDKTGGGNNNGFEVVSDKTSDNDDLASFYIYLKEGFDLYNGQPVKWRITKNESLYDNVSQALKVGAPEDGTFTTINTIPPRVSYALALPGHNEVYIQMSQPVAFYIEPLHRITGVNIELGSERVVGTASAPPFILEYHMENVIELFNDKIKPADDPRLYQGITSFIVKLNTLPGVSDLADLQLIGSEPSGWHFILSELRDMGVRALDWRDYEIDPEFYIFYPAPRYPVKWDYSAYIAYPGNGHITGLSGDTLTPNDAFVPPNRVLTPEMVQRLAQNLDVTPNQFATDAGRRRITDILVSLEPENTGSENYFVWPIYAKAADDSRLDGLPAGNDFWGHGTEDHGIIWNFDGTRMLDLIGVSGTPRTEFELQARVAGSLSGTPRMYWALGANVPANLRNPPVPAQSGIRSGGLWLPDITDALTNIVPEYYSALSLAGTGSPLTMYDIDTGANAIGGKFEFFFNFAPSDLVIARLDAPKGTIPFNWYQLVRPFQFGISEVVSQRGGVTILNNVINSDNKEITYLRYRLLRPGRVTIQVYTLEGALIKSIRRNEHRDAGEWTDGWDGTNNAGRSVARGMYYIRITGPDIDEIRKVMVIR